MLDSDIIDRLSKSSDFQEFQKHVTEQILDLDSTQGLEDLPNERAGEEAKVRSKAKNFIVDIFTPFLNARNKNAHTEEERQKAKKKFGL